MHPKFFRLFLSSAEHYARDCDFKRVRLQSPDDRESKVAKDDRLASVWSMAGVAALTPRKIGMQSKRAGDDTDRTEECSNVMMKTKEL